MARLFNIPFFSDFLQTLFLHIQKSFETPIAVANSLLILPNQRSIRAFYECAKGNNTQFLPKILSYAQIADNILEFIEFSENLEDLELALPIPATSKTHLYFELNNILNRLKLDISYKIDDLLLALSEYYHNQYKDEDLAIGTYKEQFLFSIIQELNSRNGIKPQPIITEQHKNIIGAENIEKLLLKYRNKYIFAALPANNVPYITKILQAIAKLENAEIFMHGWSKDNSNITQKHYAYHLNKYYNTLGLEVEELADESEFDNHIRQLLFPPQLLPNWQRLNGRRHAFDHIEVIEATNQYEEARLISLALENHKGSVAIVTSDRGFVAKIKALFDTKNIVYDDSTAETLFSAGEISLFFLIIKMLNSASFDIRLWLSLLKDPSSSIFSECAEQIYKFEIDFLRKSAYLSDLADYFKLSSDSSSNSDSDLASFSNSEFSALYAHYKLLLDYRLNFYTLSSFKSMLLMHFALYKSLVSDSFMQKSVFVTLQQFVDEVTAECHPDTSFSNNLEYSEFLMLLLQNVTCRNRSSRQENAIEILTPMEARLLKFDLVIVPAMQESSFPNYVKDHGYISHDLRMQYTDFVVKDLEIGYAAFDFAQLLSQKKVIMSYSKGDLESVLEPSRFIERLLIYAKVVCGKNLLCSHYDKLLKDSYNIEYRPDSISMIKMPENSVNKISMSGIERLMRNPYAYYIHDILNIKSLDSIPSSISKKDIGIFLHDMLANAVKSNFSTLDEFFDFFDKKILRNINHSFAKNNWQQDLANGIMHYFIKPYVAKVAMWFLNYRAQNRNNIIAQYVERHGLLKIVLDDNSEISVIANADRIDIFEVGTKLIDYKTGAIPSNSEVKSGKFPQLAIEGLIYLYGDCFNIDHKTLKKDILTLSNKMNIEEENEKTINCNLDYAYLSLRLLLEKFFSENSTFFATHSSFQDYKTKNYSHVSR